MLRLISRHTPRSTPPAFSGTSVCSSTTRIEVCPPPLGARSTWQRITRWCRDSWTRPSPLDAGATRPVPGWRLPVARSDAHRLSAVQREFDIEIADLPGREAAALQSAVWRARSLRELWHLRSMLYSLVACRHDQFEAERRLARLNRHFPMRVPKTGAMPLESPRDATTGTR